MKTLHLDQGEVGKEISAALCSAAENGGAAYANFRLPPEQLAQLEREARRVPRHFPLLHPIRRDIDDWINTERATLVPPTLGLLKHPYEVGALSSIWARKSTKLAASVSERIRHAGMELGLDTVSHWVPNRIGFNYMHGTESEPACIPDHEDPKGELGLVVAFDVSGGEQNGRLHFLLGDDTCRQLGITQPEHSVITRTERIGMTIAQLAPSLTV